MSRTSTMPTKPEITTKATPTARRSDLSASRSRLALLAALLLSRLGGSGWHPLG